MVLLYTYKTTVYYNGKLFKDIWKLSILGWFRSLFTFFFYYANVLCDIYEEIFVLKEKKPLEFGLIS